MFGTLLTRSYLQISKEAVVNKGVLFYNLAYNKVLLLPTCTLNNLMFCLFPSIAPTNDAPTECSTTKYATSQLLYAPAGLCTSSREQPIRGRPGRWTGRWTGIVGREQISRRQSLLLQRSNTRICVDKTRERKDNHTVGGGSDGRTTSPTANRDGADEPTVRHHNSCPGRSSTR